ncbi:unnamed protein product [Lathyrus oleraceus]
MTFYDFSTGVVVVSNSVEL